MFDAGSRSDPGLQPRAIGAASVGACRRGARSVLAGLRQQGSAKIMLPGRSGDALEAVLLNTAGGLTGGDRFAWTARADSGATLVLTTQAAERAYRAQGGEIARVETGLTLAPGARLHWLPQETILFDRAALTRRLEVEMAADAKLLAVESVILGRRAMGERIDVCHFAEQWRIRRGGKLVYADVLRIWGDTGALSGPAALGQATAFALVLLVGPGAGERLDQVRALLAAETEAEAGASAFDGCLVARMTAADGYRLRPALCRLLAQLTGRSLPRVWTL